MHDKDAFHWVIARTPEQAASYAAKGYEVAGTLMALPRESHADQVSAGKRLNDYLDAQILGRKATRP